MGRGKVEEFHRHKPRDIRPQGQDSGLDADTLRGLIPEDMEGTSFGVWDNQTREEHPDKSIIGYNTEEDRIEFYIKDEDKWYYLWSEFIAITDKPLPPYYTENFDSEWFIDNPVALLFTEDYNANWFVDNIFSLLSTEDFDSNWFIDNTFSQEYIEQFENGGW